MNQKIHVIHHPVVQIHSAQMAFVPVPPIILVIHMLVVSLNVC